jgi:DNA-binding GntR family transcriptional regulator
MAEALPIEPDDDEPPQRATAHELVRSTLRSAILRGTLPGGTRLRQADIAAQLQVSTTPVREALRDLATEGLVDLDAHRGAVVHQLGLDELREVYDLRRVLEPVAMRHAAGSLRPGTLATADDLQRQMDTVTDLATWVDLNRRFHAILLEDGVRPRLRGILRTLQDSAAPYVGLLLQNRARDPGEANAEHRELLQALGDGDGQAAAEITERHLTWTILALQRCDALGPIEPEATT